MQANKVVPDLLALLPDLTDETILSRTVYKDDRLRTILFGFSAGEMLFEHTSGYPAILHFLAGEATVTLGEETLTAQPGTWVHMPAHLPHSITAHTETSMLLLILMDG